VKEDYRNWVSTSPNKMQEHLRALLVKDKKRNPFKNRFKGFNPFRNGKLSLPNGVN
jgi:hypothetical protein